MATAITDRPDVQAIVKLEKYEEERRREISAMPSEAEVTAVEDALQAGYDKLERITWDIEKLSKSEDGHELQFQIGLADLGVLYVLSTSIHSQLDELEKLMGRIERHAFSLDCIRCEQAARAAKDA